MRIFYCVMVLLVLLVPGCIVASRDPVGMTLVVRVYDAASGVAVAGDGYWLDSLAWREPGENEAQAEGAHEFTVQLGRRAGGWLVVKRAGCERWRLRVRYEIETSKVMEVPVRLHCDNGT